MSPLLDLEQREHYWRHGWLLVDDVLEIAVGELRSEVEGATVENPCRCVASGWHEALLEQDERGCLAGAIVEQLDWRPMPLWGGRALFVHALTPHRSGPNRSTRDRRALYPTYNGASEGNLREEYYISKREAFLSPHEGDRVRMSLIGDSERRLA